jgi:AraC-like DNA-binding protein
MAVGVDGVVGHSYVERAPMAPLAGLVSAIWIQGLAPGHDPYEHRTVPNGAVEVLCPIGGMPRVIGPLTEPQVDLLAPGTTVVGLRFHPGAAAAALGVPSSALADLTLGADEIWGRSAVALGEALAGAPSPEHALMTLQRHLLDRWAGADTPDPLVAEAVRQLRWRSEDVGSLTSQLHISERQLRRRSVEAVGLAPKSLHRLLRFQDLLALVQHAIAQGRAPSEDGLAQLAAEAGYADQPHLNRECRRLTGMSPRAFLDGIEQTCAAHGHDHSASYAPVLMARPMPLATAP